MAGFVCHVGISAICPHSGQVSVVTTNNRVFVDHQPVATQDDTFIIAGCPFYRNDTYHPCIEVKWLGPATRVKVNGKPVILQNSTGSCDANDKTPQGPPNVIKTQLRVKGT